jgi:hypothetical protein
MGDVFLSMYASRTVRYVPKKVEDRIDWDVRLLTELKPTYVVYSTFESEDLERLKSRSDLEPIAKLLVKRYVEFGEKLKAEYELFRAFGGNTPPIHDLAYIRPTLWVWKRKPPS